MEREDGGLGKTVRIRGGEGDAEGRAEGIELVKQIFRLSAMGKTIEDIAKKSEISVDEVRDILEE